VTLIFDIARTHVMSRLRQTLVGVFGVATGVGFSVMMASVMEGSQRDFIATLVDTLPHISVTDEQRAPPRQPAEMLYDVAQIKGLKPDENRPGIKNPLALIAAVEAWLPGAVAPSTTVRAIVRYAGRDRAVTLLGIDPRQESHVSSLPKHMRQGTINSLLTASNAILIGDGLADKLALRVGATLSLSPSVGPPIDARVVGVFHTGVRTIDEGQIYATLRTAQVLAGQTGLVNQMRIRLAEATDARDVAARVEEQTGYKSLSWQEANEDLLSAFVIRNFIMYAVVGAILLVASFGTYNIISTITHEKTRDIAIMKSLGLPEKTVRRIFVLEALIIGVLGMIIGWLFGYLLCLALGLVEFKNPFSSDVTRLPMLYSPLHYVIAGAVALGSSVFAAYLPASRAARVNPVDIIRGAS
jgi:lipoprotein-releasing system permease protein